MENTFWSKHVQTAELLYQTRNIRFRHEDRDRLLKGIGAKTGDAILEIGCGPGSLSFRLKEWLGDVDVTALDRDSDFVAFAKKKAVERGLEVTVVQGDALNLPFEDESFDLTTSHTVIEHIPTQAFFDEQYRVLKKGGTLSVISSRPEYGIQRKGEDDITHEEQVLWDLIKAHKGERMAGVCEYALGIDEIPSWFEKTGFRDITVDFEVITYIPKDHRSSQAHQRAIIEIERDAVLECVELDQALLHTTIDPGVFEDLMKLVYDRYEAWLKRTLEGDSSWQIATNLLMMVKGIK